MTSAYVQARDGNLYLGSSRVTLESIIVNWQKGLSSEEVHDAFPTVPLAFIDGAIAYYLDHQEEVDRYLRENEETRQADRLTLEAARPEFYALMRQRFAEHPSRGDLRAPGTVRSAKPVHAEEVAARSPMS